MKKSDSGRTAPARNDGSVSRALTPNPATSPNSNSNIDALPFRVFLDSPISNGGRKWRMLAALFLEFSVVVGVIALPVWFAQSPDHVVPTENQTSIEIYIPKGIRTGKPGATGSGGDAPLPTAPRKPDFSRADQIYLTSNATTVSHASEDPAGEWIPADGPVRWGEPDGEGDRYGPGIPGGGGPPQAGPPPKYRPVGGKIDFPRQLVRVEPRYPPIPRQAGIQGDVILKVLISDRGEIESVIIASGHPLLAPAAKRAVERWRYEPTLLNGQPIAVSMDVVVRFYIRK